MTDAAEPSPPAGTMLRETPGFLRRFGLGIVAYLLVQGSISTIHRALVAENNVASARAVATMEVFIGFGLWALAAWFVYWLFGVLADLLVIWLERPSTPVTHALEHSAVPSSPPEPAGHKAASRMRRLRQKLRRDTTWKSELAEAQQKEDGNAVFDIRDRLAERWPKMKVKKLDVKLGRWFTKRFQQQMLKGRAAEALPEVERAAETFSYLEEFKYFTDVLPSIRQCAEIKASVLQDEDEE